MMELTIKEKIRLLNGVGPWETYDCNGKLPSIMMTDGPHGLRKQESKQVMQNNQSKIATCFPTASAIACSFNVDAVKKMAEAIADEALYEQVSIVLGCGVNIKRSPLCGRNFEYFSEDPFLTGTLATAYIKAMQEKGVATSLKHFAANSQETRRQTSNSQIDERALREIYLKAFEMVVKQAKPETIMAAYNRLNGAYCCANKELLTDILRNEWGFEGLVISDWGAAADIVACIKAGLDLEMPDSQGVHSKQLEQALEEGRITQEEIDIPVQRILHLVEKQKSLIKNTQIDYDAQHKIAKELATESAVLLKNDNFLPLKKEQELVIIGELAEHMRFQGGGSSHINTRPTKNAIQSLKDLGFNLNYQKGYTTGTVLVDHSLEIGALKLAEKGLPILFFGGLTNMSEGEGYDRSTLEIPENQKNLFYKLQRINPNIAFISFGGAPFTLPFIDKTKAVLHLYLAGQAVGEAVAELVSGMVNPSGKLAETFPLALEDVPSYSYYGKATDDVEYRESIFVGYRYYDSFHKDVLFPFGFGLSYTTFAYDHLQIDKHHYSGGKLQVQMTLKNTGQVTGKEVVQIYVKNPKQNIIRANKELRGFQKIELSPQEEKTLEFTLDEQAFSIYDTEQKKEIMVSGDYEILVGSSSQDIRLKAIVEVKGQTISRNEKELFPDYFKRPTSAFHISKEQFAVLYGKPLSTFDQTKKGEFTIYNSLEQLAKHSLFAKLFLKIALSIVYGMNKGKDKKDPEVLMMVYGTKEGMLDSILLNSGGIVPYRIGEAIVLFTNGDCLKAWKKLLFKK